MYRSGLQTEVPASVLKTSVKMVSERRLGQTQVFSISDFLFRSKEGIIQCHRTNTLPLPGTVSSGPRLLVQGNMCRDVLK